MANGHVNIVIGGRDGLSSVLTSALKSVKAFADGTAEGARAAIAAFRTRAAALKDSLVMESEAFQRAHKSALSAYETLDEISKRVDAPREAARAQEEHNKALARYNRLLEEAAARQRALYAKRHFFNAFDPNTFGNLSKLHGGDDSGPSLVKRLQAITASARKAWPALMMVNRAMGESDGVTAKFAQGLSGIAGMFMAFGPLGAVVGAAQAGIDALAERFKEKADRMVEMAAKAAQKMREKLAATKDAKFDALVDGLSGVTEAAEKAANRFDRMAAAKERLTASANRIVDAVDNAELAAMRRQMELEESRAGDGDKGRVGAEWRLKIAQRQAEIEELSAERARAAEEESLHLAEQRLAITEKNAAKLHSAAERAEKAYLNAEATFAESDPAYVKRFKAVADKAWKRAKDEYASYDSQESELTALRNDIAANEIARESGVADTYANIEKRQNELRVEIRKAADERQKAEIAAAQAAAKERERLDREAHQKRMADLRAEIAEQSKAAGSLRAVAASAQSEFDKAFAMYRDSARAEAEIGEEKDYRNDLERLHKDARRYGGKWRIDELSSLMAAGDTQGVSDTLATWRKSKGFTPQVEAMVRASAAENAKTTVEDELRKIETNTKDLSSKLEELISMKGGS